MPDPAKIPPPPVLLPRLPAGWVVGAGRVTPAVVQKAREVLKLNLKYGEGRVHEVEGRVWAFRLEPHYDDHADGILHWHPGISAWERLDPEAPFPEVLENLLPKTERGKLGLLAAGLIVLGMALAVRRISEVT